METTMCGRCADATKTVVIGGFLGIGFLIFVPIAGAALFTHIGLVPVYALCGGTEYIITGTDYEDTCGGMLCIHSLTHALPIIPLIEFDKYKLEREEKRQSCYK